MAHGKSSATGSGRGPGDHRAEPAQRRSEIAEVEPDRVIDQVDGLLQERTRSLFADAALPEASDSRRQWLKQSLNSDIRERGLIVTRVELKAVG